MVWVEGGGWINLYPCALGFKDFPAVIEGLLVLVPVEVRDECFEDLFVYVSV